MKEWMRYKVMLTLIAIAVMLTACTCTLAGCTLNDEIDGWHYDARFSNLPDSTYTRTVTDNETGVQYLMVKSGFGRFATMGITPLLNPDGTPMLADGYGEKND